MKPHPYFDLILHEDEELAQVLGARVVERVTLHEWPLACVQRLTLSDRRVMIYKTESGPTVEFEFYARAKSPLLVTTLGLYRDERYACLLMEDLQAPLVKDLPLTEEAALRMGRKLQAQIAEIEGAHPVYLDVSSWSNWQAVVDGMLQDLHGLAASGKFKLVNHEMISHLARCASAQKVREVFENSVGLTHHDLRSDNVFLLPDGYRVIDWQRPILSPSGIDLVLLLSSLGIDPRPHVPAGIVTLTDLLRIQWLTECTLAWFPPGVETYDQTIANLATSLAG